MINPNKSGRAVVRRSNKYRNINGVVLLDKPAGQTSNRVLQQVKRLFNARKAGHTGSLDPLATGLLPICLGEATKISTFLLDADKRYMVKCRLGVRTSTGDTEGEIIEQCDVPALTIEQIKACFKRFHGEVEQIPPMYSALRHKGQRLYDLARRGIAVERRPRHVIIHELELKSLVGDVLSFEVRCSKGTYVRTLAEDIAKALGTLAHVTALRRISVGLYGTDGAKTLDELAACAESGASELDACLMPVDSALADWPEVRLNADMAFYLRRGQPVLVPKAPVAGFVRLYADSGDFLGVGKVLDDGRIAPRRMIKTS